MIHTNLALSIRQPHLENILAGAKRFEYRSQPCNVRGLVYLYAAKTLDDPEYAHLPRGVILGQVEIVGCFSDGEDGYRWALSYPERFSEPLPFLGRPQPSFWRPRILLAR